MRKLFKKTYELFLSFKNSKLFIQRKSSESSPTIAKLQIRSFSVENSGEYRCIAENELGERISETFIVDAREEDKERVSEIDQQPYIRIDQKNIEANEGSSLSINYTYNVRNYLTYLN